MNEDATRICVREHVHGRVSGGGIEIQNVHYDDAVTVCAKVGIGSGSESKNCVFEGFFRKKPKK